MAGDEADKKLWLMVADKRDQLKCPEVLEAMNLDLIMSQLREIDAAMEKVPVFNGESWCHPAYATLQKVTANIDRLVLCRNEARERAQRRVIEETRDILRQIAGVRLGTSAFAGETIATQDVEGDPSRVSVVGTYKTADDRSYVVTITMLK